ncbi:MAG: hypothetical protein J6023_04380 [Clostridia bacterium]|nr:hypothetical protein [Clostridia bacterium]
MGFGILTIGYFTASVLSYNPMGFAFLLLGSFVMAMGFWNLSQYNRRFYWPLFASLGLFVIAILKTVTGIQSIVSGGETSTLGTVVEYIQLVLMIFLHTALCLAVYDISKKLDVYQGKAGAWRNLIVGVLYYGLYIPSVLPGVQIEGYVKVMGLPIILLMFAFYLSVTWMTFSCYRHIVPDVPEDGEVKPSRFAFVNKMRAWKADHDRRAVESAQQYYEEKLKARQEKQQQKNRKKK